jgi:hypothetical protein
MSGAQLEKDVQFAPHLRENGGIAGREKGLPHPHKAAAQTAPNNGSDQIAQGIAQLPQICQQNILPHRLLLIRPHKD